MCGSSTQSGFYRQGAESIFGWEGAASILSWAWSGGRRVGNSGTRLEVRLADPESEGEEVDSETENGESGGSEEFPVGRVAIGDGL